MKSFINWLISLFKRKPDSKPTPTPDPVPTPQPVQPDPPQGQHSPVYSMDGATTINRREAQFVCNPESSKGTAKFVMPNKYTGFIYQAYLFNGDFKESLHKLTPNEDNNRERWHGKQHPSKYPKGLWLRWDTSAGDFCYFVKDVNAREG